MTPRVTHDIVEQDERRVRCRCGVWFESTKLHAGHFGLARARAALAGDVESDPERGPAPPDEKGAESKTGSEGPRMEDSA